MVQPGTHAGVDVVLAEGDDANGAAYLLHMLLSQRAAADTSDRYAALAARLAPVTLTLSDTGDTCTVSSQNGGLVVSCGPVDRPANTVVAESGHLTTVTQFHLLGGVLIVGPFGDPAVRKLLGDVARRRASLGGVVTHYRNLLRFLALVNVR